MGTWAGKEKERREERPTTETLLRALYTVIVSGPFYSQTLVPSVRSRVPDRPQRNLQRKNGENCAHKIPVSASIRSSCFPSICIEKLFICNPVSLSPLIFMSFRLCL